MKLQVVNSIAQNILSKLGIDHAVAYGIGSRIWTVIAAPITVLLIALMFSPEMQGYYYTFISVVTLQIFVELGLGAVLIHFSSHEWGGLRIGNDGKIEGDAVALGRLASIATIGMRWFLLGSVALFCILAIFGTLFFNNNQNSMIAWSGAWIGICTATSLNILLTPIWSILEGCSQVRSLYRFRLWQSVAMNLSLWLAIILGAGLWSLFVSSVVGFLIAIYFSSTHYGAFIVSLMRAPVSGNKINWSKEMLPMQWRIAISWAAGYFAFSLFTPVLFKMEGPIVAGQMGMTWSLINLLSFATAWLSPRVPQFGMLIAQQKYDELDTLFRRTVWFVIVSAIMLVISILLGLSVLIYFDSFLMHRILPLVAIILFLAGHALTIISQPFSAYLRAHKREPLMLISIVAASLIAIATVLGATYAGVTGVALGYFLVNIFIFPFILTMWKKYRIEWRIAVRC